MWCRHLCERALEAEVVSTRPRACVHCGSGRPRPALARNGIVDDMEGDEAAARANLSQAPDTLAAMAKWKSHQPGELSRNGIVDDMESDEAAARANLSQAPDTLATMANSKSHPSGELSPGEATTRFEPGGRQVLPEGLGKMAPGAALSAVLETVDLSRLNGHDLVTVLGAEQRQISHHQARLYAAIAETAHAASADTTERSSLPNEHAADEIAAAVGYTRRKACNELTVALRLRKQLPKSPPHWRRATSTVTKPRSSPTGPQH